MRKNPWGALPRLGCGNGGSQPTDKGSAAVQNQTHVRPELWLPPALLSLEVKRRTEGPWRDSPAL